MIATAAAICGRLNAQLGAIAPSHLDIPTIARTAPQNAALERAAIGELAKLAPPASLATDWRQILAYRRTLADELVRLGIAAKANDARAVQALGVSKKRVHEQLTALARRDGFGECGQITSGRKAASPAAHRANKQKSQ